MFLKICYCPGQYNELVFCVGQDPPFGHMARRGTSPLHALLFCVFASHIYVATLFLTSIFLVLMNIHVSYWILVMPSEKSVFTTDDET